ncbi:MAG: energy-coupling factor transporter transmembrane component T [Anaerofustis sp.]
MPEWLLKNENYTPASDKDTFINKSILSLLNMLSKIKMQAETNTQKYSLNAFLKVAFTFVNILLLALSKNFAFIIIENIYMLVMLSLMDGDKIIKILKICFVVILFTLIILLPTIFMGNTYSYLMITLKTAATITSVNILSYSTKWNEITAALKRFFVPDIFILVLDITIKYIFLLGNFTLNMLYALKLRSVGKNNKKYTSLSGIAGTMFLKSKELAEDTYAAMTCRGFTGEYRVVTKFKIGLADFFYIFVNLGMIAIFIYLGRI